MNYPGHACVGVMELDGAFYGYTMEREWLDNKRMVSCIPAGSYKLSVSHSPRFGRRMIRVNAVPNRSGILIHNANNPQELHGCIAVAKRRHGLYGLMMGLSEALRDRVDTALRKGEDVTLEILNAWEGRA